MVTTENVESITITRNFSFFKNVPDFRTSREEQSTDNGPQSQLNGAPARRQTPSVRESAQPSLLTMFWNYSELFYKDIFCYSIPYSVRFTFGHVHILPLIHNCLASVCGIPLRNSLQSGEGCSLVTIYGIVLCRLGIPHERARGCQIGVVSMENKRRLSLIRTP